jgi:hypothetical protein
MLVTQTEAARRLRCDPRTIRRAIEKKGIQRRAGGQVLLADVQTWARRSRRGRRYGQTSAWVDTPIRDAAGRQYYWFWDRRAYVADDDPARVLSKTERERVLCCRQIRALANVLEWGRNLIAPRTKTRARLRDDGSWDWIAEQTDTGAIANAFHRAVGQGWDGLKPLASEKRLNKILRGVSAWEIRVITARWIMGLLTYLHPQYDLSDMNESERADYEKFMQHVISEKRYDLDWKKCTRYGRRVCGHNPSRAGRGSFKLHGLLEISRQSANHWRKRTRESFPALLKRLQRAGMLPQFTKHTEKEQSWEESLAEHLKKMNDDLNEDQKLVSPAIALAEERKYQRKLTDDAV